MASVRRTYQFLVALGFALSIHLYGAAQDSTYVDQDIFDLIDVNRIQWVDQIPPLEEDTKKERKGWFKRLIIGEKEDNTLQKPVCVIGLDAEHSIVFDQGNGTLFFAEANTLEIPRFLQKGDHYFPSLIGACKLPDNRILFTDSKLDKIFVLSENKKKLTELNTDQQLTQPTGIAYCPKTDKIWVVETAAHQIAILDKNGKRIRTIGNRGRGDGEFNFPTSIWIDKNGMAYVVDALNYRIQIFDAEGNFVSTFGENGNGTGFFASPKGIATDSYGHIYVVDALFHGVQIFDAQGNYLYQFGKQGRFTEEFWMPSGIYIDEKDRIYIADSYNSRIQIFELQIK